MKKVCLTLIILFLLFVSFSCAAPSPEGSDNYLSTSIIYWTEEDGTKRKISETNPNMKRLTKSEIEKIDNQIRLILNRFVQTIIENDVNAAVSFVSKSSQLKFLKLYDQITPEIKEKMKNIDFKLIEVTKTYAEYEDNLMGSIMLEKINSGEWKILI